MSPKIAKIKPMLEKVIEHIINNSMCSSISFKLNFFDEVNSP